MPRRCSDRPGGATQRGSGWRANRTACSASERKPLVMMRSIAVRARGALHAVEGAGDVRPHALALAGRERAGVAAARAGELGGRRELRLGGGFDPRRAPCVAGADLEDVADGHADADRRERRAVRERHVDAARAVRARDALRRGAPEREVLGLAHVLRARPCAVGEHRLEEARVRVVHRPGARERSEVGRALRPGLPAATARDQREHQRREDDRDETADDEDRRLAALWAEPAHAGNLSRPQPASAVARAPGVISGPRTVIGTFCSASVAQASSASRGSASAAVDENDVVLLGEQLIGGRGAWPADRDHRRHVDRGQRSARERELVVAERDPGEPAARDRREAARLQVRDEPRRRRRAERGPGRRGRRPGDQRRRPPPAPARGARPRAPPRREPRRARSRGRARAPRSAARDRHATARRAPRRRRPGATKADAARSSTPLMAAPAETRARVRADLGRQPRAERASRRDPDGDPATPHASRGCGASASQSSAARAAARASRPCSSATAPASAAPPAACSAAPALSSESTPRPTASSSGSSPMTSTVDCPRDRPHRCGANRDRAETEPTSRPNDDGTRTLTLTPPSPAGRTRRPRSSRPGSTDRAAARGSPPDRLGPRRRPRRARGRPPRVADQRELPERRRAAPRPAAAPPPARPLPVLAVRACTPASTGRREGTRRECGGRRARGARNSVLRVRLPHAEHAPRGERDQAEPEQRAQPALVPQPRRRQDRQQGQRDRAVEDRRAAGRRARRSSPGAPCTGGSRRTAGPPSGGS